MNCTRCQGSGFLNLEQVDDDVLAEFDRTGEHVVVRDWIDARNKAIERGDCSCHISPPCPTCELYHDVQVCDCCGDGTEWYGDPGHHHLGAEEPFPECY
jgi:hypothetical protein